MTDNTTNNSEADAGSKSALVAVATPDGQADLPEEPTELPDLDEEADILEEGADLPEDPTEIDDDSRDGGVGAGAVTGGFGFAGLALAIVSLTTNWTSSVVISHSQYGEEVAAPSSGLTTQQQLNMYANGWHTQGWWALVFAAVAVLFGAGALFLPGFLLRGRTPGWAKASATGAIIVGLVGVLLAVLTITGVFGGHLTAPTSAG